KCPERSNTFRIEDHILVKLRRSALFLTDSAADCQTTDFTFRVRTRAPNVHPKFPAERTDGSLYRSQAKTPRNQRCVLSSAADKLLFLLRSLSEKSATGASPAISGFPGSVDVVSIELSKLDNDVIRPFVLSCETKNVKLVTMAVGSLQKLISFRAISESSIPLVLKTFSNVMNTGADIQLKIIQSLLPLLTNYNSIHGDILSEILLLCFKLQESKTPVVNGTASATLRQLLVHLFDKVGYEDEHYLLKENMSIKPSASDAFMLFQA
ncbi:hypothetical protein HK096_011547, partial [Nowakowskiella sp. JEL0078]